MLKIGRLVPAGGQIKVTDEEAAQLAGHPLLSEVTSTASAPAPTPAGPTPDELRREASQLIAEAAAEEKGNN